MFTKLHIISVKRIFIPILLSIQTFVGILSKMTAKNSLNQINLLKIFKSRSKYKIILLYGVYRLSNIDNLKNNFAKFCNSSQKIKIFRIIIVNGWRWARSVRISSTLRKHNRLYKRWNLFKLIAIGALSTRLNMGMHICSKYEFLVLKLAIIIEVFRTSSTCFPVWEVKSASVIW